MTTDKTERPLVPDDATPPPTLAVRNRDIVAFNAFVLGIEAQADALKHGLSEIEAYERGWRVTADYFKAHNRRKTGYDEVL